MACTVGGKGRWYPSMLGLALVRPLEEDWRATLDTVARRRGWPTSSQIAALAICVGDLSVAYNAASVARAAAKDAGAARLGFAFVRDVPKGAAAVRELVATGALRLEREPLRVLDVGAGAGATTWGLVRALEAAGQLGSVEATWLDPDAEALALGLEVVRERGKLSQSRGSIDLRVTAVARSAGAMGSLDGLARYDVVLTGQVLSELDVGAPPLARVDRHAGLLGDLLEHHVESKGALVVVEPALRDRSRHLHAVRDVLVRRGLTVFAPCLHAGACPALACDSDWCHEDLEVDLPGWLGPVARAAGLRRQGLTFSYLVLRRDGLRLADTLGVPEGGAGLRVVSELMRSKGKREAFVCGTLDGSAVRVRATRLDRDATEPNAAWASARRGDVIVVDPAPALQRPRIGPGSDVILSDDGESR